MPKFRVNIRQHYLVTVEAESRDAAEYRINSRLAVGLEPEQIAELEDTIVDAEPVQGETHANPNA